MPRRRIATFRRIGRHSNGMLMSAEEFDFALVDESVEWDECYHYELISGVLIVRQLPPACVRFANDYLGYLLRDYRDTQPPGRLFDDTVYSQTLRIGDDRRYAHRVVWTGLGRIPDRNADLPSIVIEFARRGSRYLVRDLNFRRQRYFEAGIEEFWFLDLYRDRMTAQRRGERPQILRHSDHYRTPILPGFVLNWKVLLKDAPSQKNGASSGLSSWEVL